VAFVSVQFVGVGVGVVLGDVVGVGYYVNGSMDGVVFDAEHAEFVGVVLGEVVHDAVDVLLLLYFYPPFF